MNNEDMKAIFEQIDNLKKPDKESGEVEIKMQNDTLSEVLKGVSEEIQRVLDENNFTQEDLCRVTNMSQSNISKILNCKVVPRIETLNKIANATHTQLTINFKNSDEDK